MTERDSPSKAKCQFFLKSKGRNCAAFARHGEQYCGNHVSLAKSDGERVRCPYDASHWIRKDDHTHHLRCPYLRQKRLDEAQPYFAADCNAGTGPPAPLATSTPSQPTEAGTREGTAGQGDNICRGGTSPSSSAQCAAYATGKGPLWLQNLIQRITATHSQTFSGEVDKVREVRPEGSSALLKADHERPFTLRNALQTISIAGNMQHAQLLPDEEGCIVVEFGAGKGYLSSAVSDVHPAARRFVLVDNQSFCFKAERSMRQVAEVMRARADIKDFNPGGLPQLQDAATFWVATGKHLCGAATDFTLRCCTQWSAGHAVPEREQGSGGEARARESGGEEGRRVAPEVSSSGKAALRGLAVATCCHHRCSWQYYVGKAAFRGWGFTPEEFEVVKWMTGWALCGHNSPPGMEAGEQPRADTEHALPHRKLGKLGKKQREARCRARVEALVEAQEATLQGEAESLSSAISAEPGLQGSMPTGGSQEHLQGDSTSSLHCKAASGHPQGSETQHDPAALAAVSPDSREGTGAAWGGGKESDVCARKLARKLPHANGVGRTSQGRGESASCVPAPLACDQSKGDGGIMGVLDTRDAACVTAEGSPGDAAGLEGTRPGGAGGKGSEAVGQRCGERRVLPGADIPLEERMTVGRMCKRLIDHGRLLYLQDQGFQVESVLYVPTEVTGENRLIIAKPRDGRAGNCSVEH